MFNKLNQPAVRVAILALTLINQFAAVFGYSPIPLDEYTLEIFVSAIVFAVSAIWAAWKNNSFTAAAKEADAYMEKLKRKQR